MDTAKSSNIKRFAKGAVIVQAGDTARELYIFLQGTVGVYRNFGIPGESQINVLGQGSFYGETALFLGKEQAQTLVALSDVASLVINRRNLNEFLASQPDLAFTIIEGICKKLNAAEDALAKLRRGDLKQASSSKSPLFPDAHGSYLLNMNNHNDELLYEQKCTCPLCGQSFGALTVITSRLRLERTDPDLRTRYKDIEPLHYEIITCPGCFFSASGDSFPNTSKKFRAEVDKKVGPYKLDLEIRTGAERDTFAVFAGFYLAILCASVCLDDYQLATGGLWQKLSRLYNDCEDRTMYLYASDQALQNYLYAYENFKISEKHSQQLCYIIGDLYCRKEDYDTARNFFYLAKTNKAGTNLLKRQADLRLDEIRELKRQ